MVGAGSITVQTRDLDEAIEGRHPRVIALTRPAVTGRPTDLNVVLRVFRSHRAAFGGVSATVLKSSIDAGEFSNFIAMTKCGPR